MKLPNKIIESVKGNALKIACKLYSLISNKRTSRNGYEVCVKQSTLAKACGLSLSTVKRSLAELEEKNVITNKYRATHENGYQGCYHYSLAFFNSFTNIRYDIFEYDLSAVEFEVYVHFCKLRSNGCNSFFQSLQDLNRITGIDRRTVCRLIDSLIAYGLIRKQLKRTKLGDYTDNTYFIVARIRGKIRRSPKLRIKRLLDVSPFIILAKSRFVNRFMNGFMKNFKKHDKIKAFFDIRGSG